MFRCLIALSIIALSASVFAAEKAKKLPPGIKGTPVEIEKMHAQPRDFGVSVNGQWIKCRVGAYLFVFDNSDERGMFTGIIQELVPGESYRFIPYSGKRELILRYAATITELPGDELAFWFIPKAEVERMTALAIKDFKAGQSDDEINGKYTRLLQQSDPDAIVFSTQRNVFKGDDVIEIKTDEGTFYPEYARKGYASFPSRFKLAALWKYDPAGQWTCHRFVTYSELSEARQDDDGKVRLVFTAPLHDQYGVQEALFDPKTVTFEVLKTFQNKPVTVTTR